MHRSSESIAALAAPRSGLTELAGVGETDAAVARTAAARPGAVSTPPLAGV